MGGYLSEPIKDKESADFESDRLICGASSMQGWRENQEDAHNCCLNYDENVSFFAVYDGHGGQEVAQYCEKNLPDFIKNTEAYKKGDYEKALIDGFLGFDATIITPEVIKVLEQMSGRKLNGSDVEDESEENVKDLFLEAKMPLDQLVAKYRQEGAKIKFDSPAIKSRKDDGAGPSTSKSGVMAGCSKSSEPSSSSSELTNGEVLVNGDKHEAECSKQQPEASSAVGSSSSPKAEVASPSKAEAASSSKAEVASPSKAEAASSSKAEVASPSKAEAASSSKAELTSPSKAEAASSSKAEMASPSKAEAAGSSKSDAGSCSKSEVPKPEVSSTNGEVDDHDESEKPKTRRNQSLTRKLLMSADDSDDDDDEDSEDLDFENAQASDDDDDDEGDSVAVEMDDEDGEDDEDEDDDDEEEDEDDDECDGRFSVLPEEPGMDSGCTAVVALLAGNSLYVANAGDSRCIVCRNGEAIEMSIDHKPEDAPEMERILAAGGTVKEGRVNKGLNLSRAIGDFTYKKNSALPPTEQMIIALPDVKKLEVDTAQDEFMVLACDGIWNSMTSQEVVDFVKPKLHEGVPVSKICEQMFDHCLAPNTLGDGTGCDNMTCIIVKFKSNDSPLEVPPVVKRRCASPDDQECQDRPKRQKTDESLTGSD